MDKEKLLDFVCNAFWVVNMLTAAVFHLNKFFANANFGHLLWSIICIIASVVIEVRLHSVVIKLPSSNDS